VITVALLQIKKRNYSVQRSPTLNTVLMVEETLQKAEGVLTVAELRRRLPKQVMHQTLITILDYLDFSGKITCHENKILWTYKPKNRLKESRGLRVR
jgi:hypothetical protein